MSWMPERELLSIGFILDANCVNARQKDEAINQLERWRDAGLFQILTTEVSQREMAAGDNRGRADKAYASIFTISSISLEQEVRLLQQIESILFPTGAKTQNQKNDVQIVFDAAKYHSILVTNDGGSKSQPGGILGNRKALAAVGTKVMTPAEAVEHVRQEIELRDRSAREMAKLTGEPLPQWVGQD